MKQFIHEGEDYAKIMVGNKEYEIDYQASQIIKTLLNKIRDMEK